MSSKTLIRTGATILNRILSPTVHKCMASDQHLLCRSLEIAPPMLFPSLSKLQTFRHSQEHDANIVRRLASEGFSYPCGIPNLEFFLPDGDDSSSEPMHLLPKRTFQPSTLRRKRNHGYLARKATKGGRRVIARRIAKGRARITP